MSKVKMRVLPIGQEPFEITTTYADQIEYEKYAAREGIPLMSGDGMAAPQVWASHMAWTAARRKLGQAVPDSFDVFLASVENIEFVADELPKAPDPFSPGPQVQSLEPQSSLVSEPEPTPTFG